MASIAPTLPTWVYLHDGRLAPFEPDRLSQALFAATAALGQPDAFLARELTDSILHFLAEDYDGGVPTLRQVDDVVVKVLRELGQADLARVYRQLPAEGADEPAQPTLTIAWDRASWPGHLVRRCLSACSREAVFSGDLNAAQDAGLIAILGQEYPLEMLGCLLGMAPGEAAWPGTGGLLRALLEARAVAGHFTTIDGPEHLVGTLLENGAGPGEFLNELNAGLRGTGLQALLPLNCSQVPPWAERPASGPLFAEGVGLRRFDRLALAEELLERIVGDQTLRQRIWIDWHLGEEDFPGTTRRPSPRLLRLARAALTCHRIAFVFTRSRRATPLGPGLDRQCPATLLAVAVHLPRVAGLPGVGQNVELFLRKLGSVARWCLSAAGQKRAFLRRAGRCWPEVSPALQRGFLLDRARLLVVPVGLEAAVRLLTGQGLCAERSGAELGRRIVQRLREVLHQEGAAGNINVCVGGTTPMLGTTLSEATAETAADVTPWDSSAPLLTQLRTAGQLRLGSDQATATLLPGRDLGAEELLELLRFALEQTETQRLVLALPEREHQPTLPGWE